MVIMHGLGGSELRRTHEIRRQNNDRSGTRLHQAAAASREVKLTSVNVFCSFHYAPKVGGRSDVRQQRNLRATLSQLRNRSTS